MSGGEAAWRIAPRRRLTLDRPRIMGILNVTPDSFFDGGAYAGPGPAVERALEMVAEGADVIDVGGASTRPGAAPVAAAEQMRRVVPVIERLRAACDVPISIDTTLSVVARAAIAAGAGIVNDVSAGLEDPAMLALAAERSCGLILMHRLARPERERYSHEYERTPEYADVVEEVRRFLEQRAAAAIAAGVPRDAIVIDPGLGFGKSVEQNYRLIRGAGRLLASGFPVLSAASRKSFIGAAAGGAAPADRLAGTLAISLVQALAGVRLFRVHDVQAHRQALAVVLAIGGAAGPAA